MFDPSRREPDGPAVTAGPHLLVFTWSKNKETKSGKPVTSFNAKVIAGPEKGGQFYCTIGRDTSKKGNWSRWKTLCEYAGIETAIDLDDDDTIARCFHGVPFKADVSVTENGKFTNVDLEMILYPSRLSEFDRAEIERWHAEQAGAGGVGDDGPPPIGDDYAPGGGGGTDDEIPF